MWKPHKLSPRGPVYLAIADSLAEDLEAGRVQPEERLPTHRDLARTLGVNVVTITRAYAEAARRGLVEGHVGRGTFVRSLEQPLHGALERRERRSRSGGAGGGVIDLSFNQLTLDADQLDPMRIAAELEPRLVAALQAGYEPAGQELHRRAGAAWLGRSGCPVDPEQVLVTAGGQQGLAVALTALARPGETVLVEELTYAGIKSLAALLHLRLAPVAIDAQGLVPESLEEACRRGNPRLLYCMPNLHNPTGVVLPPERRERVAELARRYDLFVLEDDASGFLLESPPPAIATLAPERGLFLTSLSKSLSPGLRVGYLAAPEACLERVLQAQAALSWMSSALTGELATRAIEDGRLEGIVTAKRAEVRRRRARFESLLGHLPSPSDPLSPCVWVTLPEPWRGEEFVAAAERAGVLVSGAETFVVSRAHSPHAARLCLGTPATLQDLEAGLSRLGALFELFEGAPAPRRALV